MIVHGHRSARKFQHEEGWVVLTAPAVVQSLADTIGPEAERVFLRQIDTTDHLLMLIADIHLHRAIMNVTVTYIVAAAAVANADTMRTEVESPRRILVAKIRHRHTPALRLLEKLSAGVILAVPTMAVRGADVTLLLRDPCKVNQLEAAAVTFLAVTLLLLDPRKVNQLEAEAVTFLAASLLRLGPLQDLLLTGWIAGRHFAMTVARTASKEIATNLVQRTMTIVTETTAKAIARTTAWNGLKTSEIAIMAWVDVTTTVTGTEAETENPVSFAVTLTDQQVAMYH